MREETLQGKHVKHLRHILLWPVYLLPPDGAPEMEDPWTVLVEHGLDGKWHEVDDEFGDPAEFQERHYNEFTTFLPPVQRFLYGQGLGKKVHRTYGESPIKVLRRSDVAKARVTLGKGDEPLVLGIAHVDLYLFFDIDIAILALEIFADDVPLGVVEKLLFRFGRAYPAYWEADGHAGHCPEKVEWLSATGDVLAASDYDRREKYLSFVCKHRAPCIAAHWEYLLSPLVLHHSDASGPLRYRLLEYYRMPYMVFLAMEQPERLTRADVVRLGLGTDAGSSEDLPYSRSYLESFERRYCYDRYCDMSYDASSSDVRFIATGHTLVVIGDAKDKFFMSPNGGFLGRFRHQHFLLYLVAHFQKAALRMFSDRLVATVSRLDIKDAEANRIFRRAIRHALENFLRFAHRYWFHEISNQAQARELFLLTRQNLDLDALYSEVREELQDMGNFLDVEAMRKQNETVVRLTVVTIFGLVGTLTTGFLGMNLISWAEETQIWRTAAFLTILLPALAITLYTVVKSRRLSEFLDALSDEQQSLRGKWSAFLRVLFGR